MSSILPNPPKKLIDCFAEANNFILLAAANDARIAPLLPVATESFLRVLAHPNSRLPVMLSSANPRVDYSPDTYGHVVLLHKAILVLSLCAPECPKEVSFMIQHISEFMSTQEPDGFAPTKVGVETRNDTTITSDANQVVSGMASVEREEGSDVELKKKNCEGKSPDDSISISSSSPVATVKTKKGKRRKERDADTVNISKKLLEEPVPKKKQERQSWE
jgi:hypothetical protein